MSAEMLLLREAVELMRQRAERALNGEEWGAYNGWLVLVTGEHDCNGGDESSHGVHEPRCGMEPLGQIGDPAEHIASWQPAVALAVADWLSAELRRDIERADRENLHNEGTLANPKALAVARAYLRRPL